MKSKLTTWSLRILVLAAACGCFILIKKSFTNEPTRFDSITHETSVPDKFDSGNCVLNTEALPKANGVDMELYYQCQWKKYEDDSANPSLVQQYGLQFGDSLFAGVRLDVSLTDHILTDAEIDSATTKNVLMNTLRYKGEYVSSSADSVSGFRSENVILKEAKENSFTCYLICLIFKGDRIITITYTIKSGNSQCAYREFYNNYLPVFKMLLNKTGIF